MFKSITLAKSMRLMVGLFIYGLALALIVQAQLGVPPWDVLAQGIAKTLNIQFGTGLVLVSIVVMLAWIPLRIKPGVGSLANAVLIGLWANLFLIWVHPVSGYLNQAAMFLGGMALIGVASGLYISADLGAGPRDGLMLGTANRLDRPLWLVRTCYEIVVLLVGWSLGGQFREGTVFFALTIGYLMQRSIKFFSRFE